MTVYSADTDSLRVVSGRLETTADEVESAGGAASATLSAHGHSGDARTVAAVLLDAEGWARSWAASLRDRADALDGYDRLISTPTFATVDLIAQTAAGRDRALTAPSDLVASATIIAESSPHLLGSFLADHSDSERARVAAAAPHLVATAPGVPLEVRFAANRRLLEMARAEVVARIDGHLARYGASTEGTFATIARRLSDLEHELAAIDRLLAPHRNYLMVDWAGDGRIAEWIGPTTAHHIAVFVPGMGVEKLAMDGVARWAQTMIRHDPSEGDLAVVNALVYDAPDWLGTAALSKAAKDGAVAVSSFLGGLPAGRNVSLVGHSYGAVVVAQALLQGADDHVGDVVVLGAPGVGVDHVSDLPISADRFWVGLTPGDEVQAALHPGAVVDLTRCIPPTPAMLMPEAGGACDPSLRLIHGPNPAAPRFGAQVFDASVPPGVGGLAHQRYWSTILDDDGVEHPSAALRNLLLIVTGRSLLSSDS